MNFVVGVYFNIQVHACVDVNDLDKREISVMNLKET
jgi:hypothetical protein